MSNPYLSEIRIFSFGFAPKGWALCNGQTMSLSQNQALFSLMGTYYGGDGVSTFQLPNLQGCTPVHMGTGFALGQAGGEINHTLISNEMPEHAHTPKGSTVAANEASPAGNLWAAGNSMYDTLPPTTPAGEVTMSPGATSNTGGSQPHNNMQPYLTLNFCIALVGIFPSRD